MENKNDTKESHHPKEGSRENFFGEPSIKESRPGKDNSKDRTYLCWGISLLGVLFIGWCLGSFFPLFPR